MIKTNRDAIFAPSGSVWKGPRKRNHVYIDRYDHRGLEELCQVQMSFGEGPRDGELEAAQVAVDQYFEHLGEWLMLRAKPSLSPEDESRMCSLYALAVREWRKATPRVKDCIQRRLKAAKG